MTEFLIKFWSQGVSDLSWHENGKSENVTAEVSELNLESGANVRIRKVRASCDLPYKLQQMKAKTQVRRKAENA